MQHEFVSVWGHVQMPPGPQLLHLDFYMKTAEDLA